MKQLLFTLLIGCSIAGRAQSLYGDLENWRTYTVITEPGTPLQSPAHWNTADSTIFYAHGYFTGATFVQQVFQDNSAHSGSSAAKLVTHHQDTLGTLPALLTNTDISIDFTAFSSGNIDSTLLFSGGTPVSSRIPSCDAWVKYAPTGTDTAFFRVQAVITGGAVGGGDSIIGLGSAYVTGMVSSYTHIVANIVYSDATSVPSVIRLFISSSGKAPQEGSTLYIDDINMTPVGISEPAPQPCTLYPNPANDHVWFRDPNGRNCTLSVYTMDGRLVLSHTLNTGADISSLPCGMFLYRLSDEGTLLSSGLLQVAR